MPAWIARYSGGFEIGRLVTDRTAHRRQSKPVLAARDRRLMQPADIALPRPIAGRMAIHAAGMREHLAGFRERGYGAPGAWLFRYTPGLTQPFLTGE